MLFTTLHIPGIYHPLPRNASHRDTYCGLLISMLLDALRNCEILVDQDEAIYNAISQAVATWPVKHRKRGEELIKTLHDKGRFVKSAGESGAAYPDSCNKPLCHRAFAIASDPCMRFELTLTVPGCRACAALPKAVDVNSYHSSNFAVERCYKEDLDLNREEWKRDRFEKEVWEPIFRHAKYVRLHDRYPGSNLTRKDNCIIIRPRWQASLDWIVNQVKLHSRQSPPPEIDIFCEYGGRGPKKGSISFAEAENGFETWTQSMKNATGLTVRVHLSNPGMGQEKQKHRRLLVTDQIVLLVERGFDLLTLSKEEIEDVVITVLKDKRMHYQDLSDV